MADTAEGQYKGSHLLDHLATPYLEVLDDLDLGSAVLDPHGQSVRFGHRAQVTYLALRGTPTKATPMKTMTAIQGTSIPASSM